MDSKKFYSQITGLQNEFLTPSKRIEKKIQLLNEFKTFVKKNVIKSSHDAIDFFQALKYSYSEQVSTTSKNRMISQTLTLSCIGHLVKRISCQTDFNNPIIALETYPVVLPFLLSSLGEIENEAAKNSNKSAFGVYIDKNILVLRGSILDFWLAVPTKVESWIRDYLMQNSLNNSIIRNIFSINECLAVLLDLVKTYNPNLNISIYYVPLIKLCQFFSVSMNKNGDLIDCKVYENSAKLLKLSLTSNTTNEQNLIEIAGNLNFDSNILHSILSSTNDKILNTMNLSKPTSEVRFEFPSHETNRQTPDNNHIIRSLSSQDSQAANNNFNQLEISKQMNKILLSNPSYKLESLKAVQFTNISSIFSLISNFSNDFEGRETEFNWSKREKTILKLRSIIRASLFVNNNNYQKDFLSYLKTSNLIEGMNKAINSLRTTLSTSGCKLAKELFQIFEIQNFENSIIESIFKNVIKLTAATKKINSSNGNVVVCTILYKLKSFNFRIFNMIYDYSSDKNLSPRIFVGKWISIIILNHPVDLTKIFSENISLNNSTQESSATKIVEKIIAHGLNDASPFVREQFRKTFWLLYCYYPNEANALMKTLSFSALKLLNKVRPSNILLVDDGSQQANNRSVSVGDHLRVKQIRSSTLDTFKNKKLLHKTRSVSEMSGKSLISASRNEEYDRLYTTPNNHFLSLTGNVGSTVKEDRHIKGIKEPEQTAFNIGKPIRIKKNITSTSQYIRGTNATENIKFQDLNVINNSPKEATSIKLACKNDLSTIISESKSDISNISVKTSELSNEQKKNETIGMKKKSISIEDFKADLTDDTDNEINNTLANKLHIHDSRDYDSSKSSSNDTHFSNLNELEKQSDLESRDQKSQDLINIEFITKLFYKENSEDHSLAVESLIQLLHSNHKFFMNDYSLLNSGLHELTIKNPKSLFPIINIDLLPKFVDILQINDFLKVFLLYQETSSISTADNLLAELIYLLTFDDLVNNYILLLESSSSSGQQNSLVICLRNLKYLITDGRLLKFSSNKQSTIDKILLNLIFIWQKQEKISNAKEPLNLVRECVSIIEENHNQCFKFFLTDTFNKNDPVGESKNILVYKTREDFGKLIGKQWRIKTVEKGNNSSSPEISGTTSPKINIINEIDSVSDSTKSSKSILSSNVKSVNKKEDLDTNMEVLNDSEDFQQHSKISDTRDNYQNDSENNMISRNDMGSHDLISTLVSENQQNASRVDIDNDIYMIDFNEDQLKLSPVKRSNWGKSFTDQSDIKRKKDLLDCDEFNFQPGNFLAEEFSNIRAQDSNKENIKSCDGIKINYNALNSTNFAKINAYFDPLKSINKEVTPVAIYQDQKNVNDIYDELSKTELIKYRLMHVKSSGYHYMDLTEESLFQETSIAHIKKILFHLGDGNLKSKEYNVLIFILDQVICNLKSSQNKYHQITSWIIKNRGFDEIFNSLLYYVNSRREGIVIENGVIEILVIVRMLIKLSNVFAELSNIIFFNINKINKYAIINDKILQHLSSKLVEGELSKASENLLILMEEIVKEVSQTQFCSEVLLRIIVNCLRKEQLKDQDHSSIFKKKFYLKSASKIMLTILASSGLSNIEDIFTDLELQLKDLLNNDEPIIRKETVLIYSILLKISLNPKTSIKLKYFENLTPFQQNFISYYSQYL